MIIANEEDAKYIIDFCDEEDWDGFDNIIIKLKKEFDAKVLEKIDGPESRIWYLEIEGFHLSLHNNPYGNYLKADSSESIRYLKDTIEKFKVVF
jgi:hypothetical protein